VRPIKIGVTQGDNVEITDGLAAGDQVVTDGTDKLRDGAKFKLPESPSSSDASGSQDKKQHKHSDK
jgi:multidrug efflux system membrane fusion protein